MPNLSHLHPEHGMDRTERTDRTASTASSSRSRRTSTVCWGDLEIFVFPNIIGDNPAVSTGTPLSIAWEHESRESMSIDFFEYFRETSPRRPRKDLLLSSTTRDTHLLSEGYKLSQLLDVAEEISKIRKSRHANMKGPNNLVSKFRNMFERKQPSSSSSSSSATTRSEIGNIIRPNFIAGKSA